MRTPGGTCWAVQGYAKKVKNMQNVSYGTINVKFELVERVFSSYTFIKYKYRNKLNASPDLRLYLASFEPDFKKLSASKEAQRSH
jgi:hypothetical protein